VDPITTHNKYSELLSDDSEDDAEDVPDIDLPRVSSSMPKSTFEPEMLEVEAVNAIVMFLGDMERVRLHIEALWKDYKTGKIDLITAAVTTNTAIELLQRPHDELMQRVMPQFNNNFGELLLFTFAQLRGYTTGQIDENMMNDLHRVDGRDVGLGRIHDFMMLPFVAIFDSISDFDCAAGHLNYSSKNGIYDPNTAFGQLSYPSKWQQYQILLMELFFGILYEMTHEGKTQQDWNALCVDAVLRQMGGFIETRETSFQLTFAMRVYMDINLTMGSEASRGRQYLHDTAGRMIENLDQRPSLEGTTRGLLYDEAIARVHSDATFCVNFHPRKYNSWPGREEADWLMFERHPLLCGLLVFRLQIVYSTIGLELSNAFTSIQSAAHLYQACRHSGQMPGGSPLQD
jgi:hypothetical protein